MSSSPGTGGKLEQTDVAASVESCLWVLLAVVCLDGVFLLCDCVKHLGGNVVVHSYRRGWAQVALCHENSLVPPRRVAPGTTMPTYLMGKKPGARDLPKHIPHLAFG